MTWCSTNAQNVLGRYLSDILRSVRTALATVRKPSGSVSDRYLLRAPHTKGVYGEKTKTEMLLVPAVQSACCGVGRRVVWVPALLHSTYSTLQAGGFRSTTRGTTHRRLGEEVRHQQTVLYRQDVLLQNVF